MADEEYTFSQARARLDELVAQARRKDMSLEQSMDVLDEGVRLINRCTELVDQVEVRDASESGSDDAGDEAAAQPVDLGGATAPAVRSVSGE